jgi:LacI family transcriptional regulator
VARRRVTLLDVAQRAGVSRTTASFVLTGRQDMRISEPVKERVLRVAQELEYRPNLAARSLRTRSTQTIGLISDTIATEQFAGEMISGALAAAAKHGFLLVVGESEDNPEVEASLITGMLDRGVDGLIYGTMFTRQAEVPDSARQSPLVLLNCLTTPLPAPAVIPDEHEAGRTAARALVEAGHRDGIWLVGERPAKLFAARERSRGIRAELAASGAAVAGTVDCGWSPWLAYDAMSALLRRGERPAACICMNDRTAMGVYQAVQEAGLDIPGEVSVVSFDDSDLASWLRPQLTSVALPHYGMGFRAMELLVTAELRARRHRIPMPLAARSSIAPPR